MSDDPRVQRARDAVECDDLGMAMADDFDWRELVRALLAVVGKQRDDWVGLSMDVADLECQLSTTEGERDEARELVALYADKHGPMTLTGDTRCPNADRLAEAEAERDELRAKLARIEPLANGTSPIYVGHHVRRALTDALKGRP